MKSIESLLERRVDDDDKKRLFTKTNAIFITLSVYELQQTYDIPLCLVDVDTLTFHRNEAIKKVKTKHCTINDCAVYFITSPQAMNHSCYYTRLLFVFNDLKIKYYFFYYCCFIVDCKPRQVRSSIILCTALLQRCKTFQI